MYKGFTLEEITNAGNRIVWIRHKEGLLKAFYGKFTANYYRLMPDGEHWEPIECETIDYGASFINKL
jgi:hypothetical protein